VAKKTYTSTLLLMSSIVLFGLSLSVRAASCVEYMAPGDPCTQGWTSDLRGITVGDITDVVNGTTYPAWQIDSQSGQKGWYLNTDFTQAEKKVLLRKGWTWTYISRTKQAPSRGYHYAKFRDGNKFWELQFRQNRSSSDGLWIRLGEKNDRLLKAMQLDDDYHTFQLTCTPGNPGSYDDNDFIEVYVDGEKVYEMFRSQQGQNTGIWRGEVSDEAIGGAGNFAINLYKIEVGVILATSVSVIPSATVKSNNLDQAKDFNGAGTEAIDSGLRWELFVDRTLIDRMDGVELCMHRPQPAEKVMEFNQPWEGAFAGYATVIKDGNLYRMYYRAGGNLKLEDQVTCLAESEDGIHWIKPERNLYECDGSKNNNIVFADDNVAGHNFSPFLDTNPDCPPDERYKALGGLYRYTKDPSVKGLLGFVSPDGIHWKTIGENPLIERPNMNAFDSQNVAFWSLAEKKYICYCRMWLGTDPSKGNYLDGIRWIGRTTSDDFINWSEIKVMGIVHDGKDAPKYDLYTNQTHPYYRAPHIYIGTAARFMEGRQIISDEQAKEIRVNPKYYKDCSDAILLSTRAGTKIYQQTFLSSFLRPGIGLENWISRTNYPVLNIVQTSDTEMSLYVNQHYAQPTAHIQRYTLRIDGFVSVHARFEAGTLLTKPIRLDGDKLELNFWTSAAGVVQVEIQNENGKAFEGYALEDCREMIGNEISRTVYWKHGPDVSNLSGKEICLLFRLKDADIYSFRFGN